MKLIGTISIATTQEEFEAAYRVRFKCLTEELGDERYADYERSVYIDKMDKAGKSIVLLGKVADEVVATQRITFRRDGPFTADEIYPYSRIGLFFNLSQATILQRIVLYDRAAVLQEFRSSEYHFFSRMMNYNYEYALEHGCTIIIGFVDTSNMKAVDILQKRLNWSVLESNVCYKNRDYILLGRLLPIST